MLTCGPTHACACGCMVSNLSQEARRRSSTTVQAWHHHDDTGHTTQQTMINAWWHSNLRARAFTSHAQDNCGLASALFIAKRNFFLPFLFFSKRIGKTRKTGYQVSPAVAGEETGGCMRPVLSYCVLPGFTIFYYHYFYHQY